MEVTLDAPLVLWSPALLTGTWLCGHHGNKLKDAGRQSHQMEGLWVPECVCGAEPPSSAAHSHDH